MVNFIVRGAGRRSLVWGAAAASTLLAAAVTLITLTGTAGAGKHRITAAEQFLKATYVPIKLRAPGDAPEVRFDISCLPPDGNADGSGGCDGGGTVYFSSANASAGVALRLDRGTQVGRYVAAVPSRIWNAPWFSYYAVIGDNTTGQTITVPSGGAGAPQLSFAMSGATIALGAHRFGATRPPTGRVASATWGGGDGQVGLENGVDEPVGGSSFDVDSAGTVYLLDEANGRMLHFQGRKIPEQVSLPALARVRSDLRVSDTSGRAYVLEVPNVKQAHPLLRAYTLQGSAVGSSPIADAAAAQIDLSPTGTAFVSEYPSSMWAPVLQGNGRSAVQAVTQLARALPGAPAESGDVIVLAEGNEVRVGTYVSTGTGYKASTVRITSDTPVADVQLAQRLPSGRLLVVFSVYTDTAHEYEAVVVDAAGSLVQQFSLPAADWAQSMPLSRFRLVGSSLYELGSTASGVFVDRYDLGVS